eukprot:Em0019g253a
MLRFGNLTKHKIILKSALKRIPIFGTDLSESNKSKGHKFAEEHGLQKYNYVLHPRTKGFVHCVQALRQGGRPVPVYNMTIGYVGAIPQNETDIATGRWPDEIHFDCTYIPSSELPLEESELEGWLKACWQQKEEKLKAFYANGHFNTPYFEEGSSSRARLSMLVTLIFWAAFHYCHFLLSLPIQHAKMVLPRCHTALCNIDSIHQWFRDNCTQNI